jgi:hypothetical protein
MARFFQYGRAGVARQQDGSIWIEESTELVKPLTPVQVVQIAEIKNLPLRNEPEREETGAGGRGQRGTRLRDASAAAKMKKTREQLDIDQRKRDARLKGKKRFRGERESSHPGRAVRGQGRTY